MGTCNSGLRVGFNDSDNYITFIFQYVEFSTGDEEDRFDAQNVLKKDEELRESLEVSLMEKNKRLENEFTQMKVSYANIEKELATKESTYNELKAKNTGLASLVQRLEEDLLRLGQKPSSSDSLMAELTRTPSSTNIASTQQQQQQQSSQQPQTPGSAPRTPDYGSPRVSYDANSVPTKDGNNNDKSILPIVIGQRDRFRQRNTELEGQTRSLELKLQDVQGEIETLKADNLKLYERLRFVHVWREEQSQGVTVSTSRCIYIVSSKAHK